MARQVRPAGRRIAALAISCAGGAPGLALAQASPFAVGAGAFQGNLLAILTPVAIIAVMILGVGAWFNRISWGWAVSGVLGIALFFGAPQIVAWIRGLFGV
jgi:type IV secretion system protein VirB2